MSVKVSPADPRSAGADPHAPFVPPRVGVGQVVLWSYGPNEKPSAAIVTTVGAHTINCLCHVDGVRDHLQKVGVRHKDDPFVRAHPLHDVGVWQLSERDQRLDALLGGGGGDGEDD